ncbi:hypothetical protein T4B_15284 [Trichinella pseudospiralis]|uniref:Uncharacterized protein n=2 Tax=Trichinella pseudospiralis TaxID=6337 RepID=A0A0V1J341_TRIPS|nr:hypothetical protein T4B_15284 [Trichinella pseudospiralis]KRZ38472.1 hypothetical protein T4C_4286 [Trichinella pseudospiralis]
MSSETKKVTEGHENAKNKMERHSEPIYYTSLKMEKFSVAPFEKNNPMPDGPNFSLLLLVCGLAQVQLTGKNRSTFWPGLTSSAERLTVFVDVHQKRYCASVAIWPYSFGMFDLLGRYPWIDVFNICDKLLFLLLLLLLATSFDWNFDLEKMHPLYVPFQVNAVDDLVTVDAESLARLQLLGRAWSALLLVHSSAMAFHLYPLTE